MLKKNKFKGSSKKSEDDSGRFLNQLSFILHLISYVLVLSLTSIILIFGYDLITQTSFFNATTIELKGLEKLSKEKVLSHARIETEMNIFSKDLEMMRKRIISHAWIQDADISRILPGTFIMNIREQRPLAIIDLGEKFLINKKGKLFKRMEATDASMIDHNLPMVKGLTLKDLIFSEGQPTLQYTAVIELLNMGQKTDALYPNDDIKSIIVDQEAGLTMEIRMEKDARVYSTRAISSVRLGFGGYPEKYNILESFIKKMEINRSLDEEGFKLIDLVELNNSNRIVVKFANT